jgi:hypothetical protein
MPVIVAVDTTSFLEISKPSKDIYPPTSNNYSSTQQPVEGEVFDCSKSVLEMFYRSRRTLIIDQNFYDASAPPGKEHPAPMIEIGSAMGLGTVSRFSETYKLEQTVGDIIDNGRHPQRLRCL